MVMVLMLFQKYMFFFVFLPFIFYLLFMFDLVEYAGMMPLRFVQQMNI